MSEVYSNIMAGRIRPIFAAIRTVPIPVRGGKEGEMANRPVPFVTISREGGAGGRSVGQRLVDRLNEVDPGDPPWTLWDRELVEKVAADHHISRDVVESLENTSHSWMEEFLAGLMVASGDEYGCEAKVYQRVAMTIRALAQGGRVVIVGRGGVYLTRNMPGGVHLRLVAPFDYRVATMAGQLHLPLGEAAEYVKQLDKNRQAFYRRYWPREVVQADRFTMTLNTAVMDERQTVECLLPLLIQEPVAVSNKIIPSS